jgi:hypothetical protein
MEKLSELIAELRAPSCSLLLGGEAFQFRNVTHPIALLNSVLALLSRDLTVPAFT